MAIKRTNRPEPRQKYARTLVAGRVLRTLAPLMLLFCEHSRAQQAAVSVVSTLQTIAVAPTEQPPTPVYSAPANFEAPNYTHDAASLIFDQSGTIYRIPVTGGTPQPVPMGENMRCNGSHGVSPDGTLLAVS